MNKAKGSRKREKENGGYNPPETDIQDGGAVSG